MCNNFRFYIISFFDCAEFLYYRMSGVICSRTQTFLASSIILPHKPKSKNRPLFSNSTKLNCSNAVTLLSSHKANPVAHSTFWFNFWHARIFKWLLHANASATTQNAKHRKNTPPRKPVMLVRIKNHPQQEPTSYKQSSSRLLFPEWGGNCRSHISRRVLDFSEVLIQLLNHQNNTDIFSPRIRSQVMFALLCNGRLA